VIVDPDDPTTWPEAVYQQVCHWDEQGTELESTKLIEEEHLLHAHLAGYRLRAYHCTRLTEEEVASIRADGLSVFSKDVFDRRIENQRAVGHLDDYTSKQFMSGHLGVAEPDRSRNRWGKVSLSVGKAVLDNTEGVELLLGLWGGEGIYFSKTGLEHTDRLATIGTPTVIVCSPRIGDAKSLFFPTLAQVFLAAHRSRHVYADFYYHANVPPDFIEAFWQPGSLSYDQLPNLPR
jgi:hypothetical protein